jgi:hypothetical protein
MSVLFIRHKGCYNPVVAFFSLLCSISNYPSVYDDHILLVYGFENYSVAKT